MSHAKPAKRKDIEELYRLRQEEQTLLRTEGLKSTWFLASEVLWRDVEEARLYEPFHKPLCDFVDSCPPGGRRGVIVARGHRKTFLLTVAHTVRRIICDPDVRVLIVTALDDTAKKMATLIKRQFTENERFKSIFPEFAIHDPKLGTQYEFEHPLRRVIELNPTVKASYLGAPLIGRRADIVIVDDGVSEDKVATPEQADKTNTQITELIPILDLKPAYNMMFIFGTPKSHNDYYALMSGQSSSTTKQDAAAVPVFETIRRSALEDKEGKPDLHGEVVLPTVFTQKELHKRLEMSKLNPAQGEGYFYREYLCLVQSPLDQRFQPEWFDTWVEPQQVPPNTVFSGFSIDSAFKDEQLYKGRGDTTVCLVGHYDTYGNLYLTDGIRGRYQTEDFRKLLLSMLQHPKNLGAQNLIKEKVGEGTIFTEFKRWFVEARRPLVVHALPMGGRAEKSLRILNALQGPVMGRKVFFVKDQFPEDLHRALVDELTHLGQWGHDDVADALSLFFRTEVRILPSVKSSTQWKDVVVRQPQISTGWNNPMTLGHNNPQPLTTNERLTLLGETTILKQGQVAFQPESTAVENEAWWEKV